MMFIALEIALLAALEWLRNHRGLGFDIAIVIVFLAAVVSTANLFRIYL